MHSKGSKAAPGCTPACNFCTQTASPEPLQIVFVPSRVSRFALGLSAAANRLFARECGGPSVAKIAVARFQKRWTDSHTLDTTCHMDGTNWRQCLQGMFNDTGGGRKTYIAVSAPFHDSVKLPSTIDW